MATEGSLGLADEDRVAGMEALEVSQLLSDWEVMFVSEMRKKLTAGEELNTRQKQVLERFYDEHVVKGEIP